MIIGALAGALACFLGLQALLGSHPKAAMNPSELIRMSTLSPIEWKLHQLDRAGWYQRWLRPLVTLWASRLRLKPTRLDPEFLVQAGVDPTLLNMVELRMLRLLAAASAAAVGLVLTFLTGAFTMVPLFSWLGYIAPVRVLAARRRRRQAALLADLPELIGMLRAFLAAGMSLERALHVLSVPGPPDSELKREIRAALARYGLGISIEEALAEMSARTGVDDIEALVTALSQSKRAGTGLETSLHDQELMVRMNRRNRATAQAGAVSTRLLAVLAGIYLPEFVLLIIIPLFWGIMQRAFG